MLGVDGQAGFTGGQGRFPILALQVAGSEQGMAVGIVAGHGDDPLGNGHGLARATVTQQNLGLRRMRQGLVRGGGDGGFGFGQGLGQTIAVQVTAREQDMGDGILGIVGQIPRQQVGRIIPTPETHQLLGTEAICCHRLIPR